MWTNPKAKVRTGDGRDLTVADLAKLYRTCYSSITPASGKIRRVKNGEFLVTCGFKAIDCDVSESISLVKVCSITAKSPGLIDSITSLSDGSRVDQLAHIISEDASYSAILKNMTKGETKEPQILEIWSSSQHLKTIVLSEIEAHGQICVDPVFNSISWNQFRPYNKLLYVCQSKKSKNFSYFSEKITDDTIVGREYVYNQDWGETVRAIEHTVIAILDLINDFSIKTIDVEGYSLSDAHWMDNDSKIVSVAYREQPRKLGLVYCNNRDSEILIHDSDKLHLLIRLNSEASAFLSPRVSNCGNKLVFLSSPKFGAHYHPVKLNLYNLEIQESRELNQGNQFYIYDIPLNCFSSDDKSILFVSSDRITEHLNRLNLETNVVTRLKFPSNDVEILDFKHDMILASGSDISLMPTVFIAPLSEHIAWHQIDGCVFLDDISYESHIIPTDDKTDSISAILVQPNLDKLQSDYVQHRDSLIRDPSKLPTLIMIHGGPHSNSSLRYLPHLLLHSRLGLKTLLINYRGSTGVSAEHSNKLCGNIGDMDVNDCLHAIRYMANKGLIEPSKLSISGGSHGGFIVCHLSCQDEFKFRSATIRNPVVDLSSLYTISDIPDWAFVEGLGHKTYDPAYVPNSSDLVKLFQVSPISASDRASVPTLMLLGRLDLRVPMSQGLRWIDVLRARGIEAYCKIYDDRHDLSRPEVHSDHYIASMIWILNHL